MSNRLRQALRVTPALASLAASGAVFGATPFKVLNHERVEIEARPVGSASSAGQTTSQHVSLDAYGRHFELTLEPNSQIARAVPRARADIEPLRGVVDGQPGSWVRLTRTRSGWRGVISDGHELYAIEPAAEVAKFAVQPLTGTAPSSPVMYRLADALMPRGVGFCATATAGEEGTPPFDRATAQSASGQGTADGHDTGSAGRATAQGAYQALAGELQSLATQDPASTSPNGTTEPTRELVVGVVADYSFFDANSDDPEGAVIARMDVVDGIYSSQLGIKIALAPVTVFRTSKEPFSSTTVPNDLLTEVRQYRNVTPAQLSTGVTHLMTGRDLDGDIVGIAYVGSVCTGPAVSLSQATISTTMSSLITAHEIGHNFNAPHDGVAGACATTPQTYLMAPRINFNNQFSDCSLQQIEASAATAQCLTSTAQSVGSTTDPSGSSSGSGSSSSNGGGGRLDFALLALLATRITVSLRRPRLLRRQTPA